MALKRISGFFKKTGPKGNTYYSGNTREDLPAGANLILSVNRFAEQDRADGKNPPDLILNLIVDDEEQSGGPDF